MHGHFGEILPSFNQYLAEIVTRLNRKKSGDIETHKHLPLANQTPTRLVSGLISMSIAISINTLIFKHTI